MDYHDATSFVLWKANFVVSLNESPDPFELIARTPDLLRNASSHSFFTLTIKPNPREGVFRFSAYLMVIPDAVNVVRDQLEDLIGYDSFEPIQSEPGEPFEIPDNQTITEFEGLDVTFYDGVPFNVLGRLMDIAGLQQNDEGWYWTFHLFDREGHAVFCYLYTDREEHQIEGFELPFVEEGQYALCINCRPEGGDCIRIDAESEFLIASV